MSFPGLSGFKEGITHVVTSIVISLLINTIPPLFHVDPNWIIFLNITYAIINLVLIIQLTREGYFYLIGWIIGVLFLVYSGILGTNLIGIIELMIDIAIPIIAIILKHFVLQEDDF